MTLHSKLAEVRAERGLTQNQIVALVEPTFKERGLAVTQGMWSAWEAGQRPEDPKIAALEDALGLEPRELFGCLRDSALVAPTSRDSGNACFRRMAAVLRNHINGILVGPLERRWALA